MERARAKCLICSPYQWTRASWNGSFTVACSTHSFAAVTKSSIRIRETTVTASRALFSDSWNLSLLHPFPPSIPLLLVATPSHVGFRNPRGATRVIYVMCVSMCVYIYICTMCIKVCRGKCRREKATLAVSLVTCHAQ